MVRTIRRADPNKRDDIRAVLQYYTEAGFTQEEIIFCAMNEVPDATGLEWCWAKFFVGIGDTVPNRDWMHKYRQWEREFNLSVKNPDEEIIGVPQTVKTKKGKIAQIVFRKLAVGQAAENMAKFCDIVISGWKNKQGRLYRYARDPQLKAKHAAKYQALKRKARRSGKGGAGIQ